VANGVSAASPEHTLRKSRIIILVEFIEAPVFTEALAGYLDADEYRVTIYGNDEVADLSPSERRALKTAMDEELRLRAEIRRGRGR
jgi:hypothetical protein